MNPDNFTRILRCIESSREVRGITPTIYEIAEKTGLSKSTVSRLLSVMRERGMITGGGHRGVIPAEERREHADTVRVPLLGAVACGLPRFAEENIEEYIPLPAALFGRGEYFLLRAKGESMIEAGIGDGDLVLVRRQNSAETGQIVVALMGEEATLKRYYPEPALRRVRLQPENSTMKPIYVSDCTVQGVAVKVIRDLK